MKNIILLIIILSAGIAAGAQTSSTNASLPKSTTPAKKAEPVISSINTVNQAPTGNKILTKDNSGSVAPVTVVKINPTPVDQTGSVAPSPEIKSIDKPAAVNPVNSTQTGITIPATQQKPGEEKTPNTTNTLKPAEPPVSTITRPVAIAVVVPVTVETSQSTGTSAVNVKIPEVKIDNTKQVKLEEVPPTVANPVTKVPVVTDQAIKKTKTKE